MNTKHLLNFLHFFVAADRACPVVRWIVLVLSALILPFAVVATIPPVIAEH